MAAGHSTAPAATTLRTHESILSDRSALTPRWQAQLGRSGEPAASIVEWKDRTADASCVGTTQRHDP
ncbi:MAG: hypothetical protein M9893_09190 [Pyrinomonadaceae bacterium]|nr:hypothetical protein [Pyrinomonadaceae bacterium]